MLTRTTFLLGLAAVLGCASLAAAPVSAIRPDLELWTEDADQDFLFYEGEVIDVRFRVNRDAYVVIVALDPLGRKKILFPNQFASTNWVTAGQSVNLAETATLRAVRTGPLFIKAFVCTSGAFSLDRRANPQPFWWPTGWGPAYVDQDDAFGLAYVKAWHFGEPELISNLEINRLSTDLSSTVDADLKRFDPLAGAFIAETAPLFERFPLEAWNEEEMVLYVAPHRFNPDYYHLMDETIPVHTRFRYRSAYYENRYANPLYYEPLEPYGNWITWLGTRVWVPSVRVVSWRPYLRGHWEYGPWGWAWSYDATEPWGGIVYRYGHWTRIPHHGWVWVPRRTPSQVVWLECGEYIGWSPHPLPRRTRLALGFRKSLTERYGAAARSVFVPRRHFVGYQTRGVPYHALYYVWHQTDIASRVVRGRTLSVRTSEEFRPATLRARTNIHVPRRSTDTRTIAFSRARRTSLKRMGLAPRPRATRSGRSLAVASERYPLQPVTGGVLQRDKRTNEKAADAESGPTQRRSSPFRIRSRTTASPPANGREKTDRTPASGGTRTTPPTGSAPSTGRSAVTGGRSSRTPQPQPTAAATPPPRPQPPAATRQTTARSTTTAPTPRLSRLTPKAPAAETRTVQAKPPAKIRPAPAATITRTSSRTLRPPRSKATPTPARTSPAVKSSRSTGTTAKTVSRTSRSLKTR